MPSDEVLKRLGAQSRVVRELRADAVGLVRDDVLGQIEVTQLRPLDQVTEELLRRLTDQAEVSKVIARHANMVNQAFDLALRNEAAIRDILDEVVDDMISVHDHVALAIVQDEHGRFAEMEVLGLLQEANLIGFGSS